MSDLAVLAALRDDPEKWVHVAFGGKVGLQAWQREALRRVRDGDQLSIASCNGAGKSFFLGLLMLWYLTTRAPTKVVVTANSQNQLFDVLWSEAAAMIKRLEPFFRDALEWRSDRIQVVGHPNSMAVARTARREQPDALQGHHSPNMLFLVDEASGVDDKIFEVGSGSLSTKGAKIVLTGNPLRRQGYFFETHNRNSAHWGRMNIAANERLAEANGVEFHAEYVEDKMIEHIRDKWGSESAQYRSRVLGLFPEADSDVFIPGHLVEAAMKRDIRSLEPVVWGVDVARYGSDRSVLIKRRGKVVDEPPRFVHGHDTMEVTGWLVNEYGAEPDKRKPVAIYVDTIGVGSGVADRLREQGLPVVDVNVSEVPSSKKDYLRLRDELWGRVREWLQGQDVRLPDDPELLAELTTPTYRFESSGRIKVEAKDDIRKRTDGRSPDLADALCLTFAGGPMAMAGGFHSAWRRGQPLRRKSPYLEAVSR